ncbi:uncharacterized protein BDFB_001727 [Asbolus verrucosus]|uniref:Uncharacterized protein n=1 Tax=Asbolus verrucosus TaxID=1661398 RepID=A0A482WAQ2_ASBVE|nr:uncharacterized protein BDFB_001727 [Asbolus verrucosus]
MKEGDHRNSYQELQFLILPYVDFLKKEGWKGCGKRFEVWLCIKDYQIKLKKKSKRQTRRSTLESIKDAIDKSCDHGIKLVNADSIERKNIGQHFKVMTSLESFPMTKTDNKYSAFNDSVQGNVIQKQDLQTQTSLQLEKLLAQMSQNKRSN